MRKLFASSHMRCAFALGALILLAFAARAYQLGAQDIWWDEGRNIFTASRPLDQIASAKELDIHPPFYFYLLHGWMSAAGTSEFAVRFFSLWFGVAGVALAFRLGASIADRRTGLWSAFLVALAPFLIDEAQQARMYTLLIFLSALSMYFLARATLTLPLPRNRGRDQGWGLWILYTLFAAASFYTHYSFIYLLAAQILYLLWQTLAAFRARLPIHSLLTRWITSQLVIATLYAFQIPNIIRQSQIYGNPSMTPPAVSFYLSELVRAFLIGVKVEPERAAWIGAGVIAALLAALAALWANRRGHFELRGIGLVLLWFIVPIAGYYVVLQISPQFTQRYALVAILPLFLLFAIALARLSRSFRATGALAALVLFAADAGAFQSQFTNPAFFNDDTRGVVQFLAQTATKDDLVLIDVPFPFDYYYRGAAPAQYFFVDIHTAADELTRLAQNKQRVFWIRWSQSDTDPRGVVLFLLDKYGTYLGDAGFRGYEVVWYQLPRAAQFSLAPAPQSASARFGERVVLTGFVYGGAVTPSTPDPNAPRVRIGSKAWVALWWQIERPVGENFKVSIQLRDANGNLAAQDDRQLINDRHLPTRWWTTRETVINVYTPELMEGVKLGEYAVYVIVYDPKDGARLMIGEQDELRIGILSIIE